LNKENFMKFRNLLIAAVLGIVAAISTVALAGTVFNAAAAPTGTHVQTGTPTCTVTNGAVTCSSYELAGVGNANAQASLTANYTATVQCRNHGGQIVEVKSQVTGATATTGALEPKNGKLSVPSLSSSPVPTNAQFEAQATCPNGNWTKQTLAGSITLASFTYTLHFVGFTGNYITITP
jgi:hypothetical protein